MDLARAARIEYDETTMSPAAYSAGTRRVLGAQCVLVLPFLLAACARPAARPANQEGHAPRVSATKPADAYTLLWFSEFG